MGPLHSVCLVTFVVKSTFSASGTVALYGDRSVVTGGREKLARTWQPSTGATGTAIVAYQRIK